MEGVDTLHIMDLGQIQGVQTPAGFLPLIYTFTRARGREKTGEGVCYMLS